MVCGNVKATWTVLFYHQPTNTYVRTGQECADKLEMSYGDFNAFRRGITNAIEALAGKKKARAKLELEGLGKAWEIYPRRIKGARHHRQARTLRIIDRQGAGISTQTGGRNHPGARKASSGRSC
jgi:hypothetical protein